jgi:hypothetical protein
MNAARKRVITAEAYETAYDAIQNKIEIFEQDIKYNEESIEEKKKENADFNEKDNWNYEQILEYKDKIEIYKEVQKAILK